MTHPKLEDLALYAGGDLSWWARRRMARHLGVCAYCRREVEQFSAERTWLEDAGADFPQGVSWDRLAAEMKANIRLGLAAGECVGEVETPPARLAWRTVAAVASVVVVVFCGWLLQRPEPAVPAGWVLEATPAGIGVVEDGRGLTLLHPDSGTVLLSVGAQGAMRARWVDTETGQVTIHHVYAH